MFSVNGSERSESGIRSNIVNLEGGGASPKGVDSSGRISRFAHEIMKQARSLAEGLLTQPSTKITVMVSDLDGDLRGIRKALIGAWEKVDSDITRNPRNFNNSMAELKRLRAEYAKVYPGEELILNRANGERVVLVSF